jgi:hypothetical protein
MAGTIKSKFRVLEGGRLKPIKDNQPVSRVTIKGDSINKIYVKETLRPEESFSASTPPFWDGTTSVVDMILTADSNNSNTKAKFRVLEGGRLKPIKDNQPVSRVTIKGDSINKIYVKETLRPEESFSASSPPFWDGTTSVVDMIQLIEEQRPEPESGEILWQSKGIWDRDARPLEIGKEDSNVELIDVGDPEAKINGDGTVTVNGKSPRLYISKKNKDVEFSAEVLVEDDAEIVHLIARSNHEKRPHGFGGYYLYANFKGDGEDNEQKLYFKKEIYHDLYSSRLKEKKINFEKNKWYPFRISVKNDDDNVDIEGEFNGVKISLVDDGKIKCGNDNDTIENTRPFTDAARWCFIRTNRPENVKYRNVIIKKI